MYRLKVSPAGVVCSKADGYAEREAALLILAENDPKPKN